MICAANYLRPLPVALVLTRKALALASKKFKIFYPGHNGEATTLQSRPRWMPRWSQSRPHVPKPAWFKKPEDEPCSRPSAGTGRHVPAWPADPSLPACIEWQRQAGTPRRRPFLHVPAVSRTCPQGRPSGSRFREEQAHSRARRPQQAVLAGRRIRADLQTARIARRPCTILTN